MQSLKQMVTNAVAFHVLSQSYTEAQIEALPVEKRQQLARLEGSAFPEEVKAALRARIFGDNETADKIRASVPHLFTGAALHPLRDTIPNLARPSQQLVASTLIPLRHARMAH